MVMPTILIDTREQTPWQFGPAFVSQRTTLQTGDYTVAGLRDRVVIERKSLGDFVQTVIRDWLRFRKELYRLAAFDAAMIVVESTLEQIHAGQYESDAEPLSIIGRAHACYLDHGVPVVFAGSPAAAALYAERFFLQAITKMKRD